jgi:hypothetical protein
MALPTSARGNLKKSPSTEDVQAVFPNHMSHLSFGRLVSQQLASRYERCRPDSLRPRGSPLLRREVLRLACTSTPLLFGSIMRSFRTSRTSAGTNRPNMLWWRA